MASGTSVVDFGAFPGKAQASVAVIGQGAILSGSLVEAWISLTPTATHSADEHMVENYYISAGLVVAGVGFTIYMEARAPGSRLYGTWNVNWAWA